MPITSFINAGGKAVKSKAELFAEQSRGKSKEQVRELEQAMLVPGKLPPYTRAKTHKDSIAERSVRIVFPTQESFILFKKYFKVSTYVEQNVTDLSLLIELLEAVDAGEIKLKSGKSAPAKPRNCKRS